MRSILSKRETELLHLLRKGLQRREVAELMQISLTTYDSYRKSIRNKLNVQSQADWARILLNENL